MIADSLNVLSLSPNEIASRIRGVSRHHRKLPCARGDLEAMSKLTSVSDEASYRLVAAVRRGLGNWRGEDARQIKEALEKLLTLYRVERWNVADTDAALPSVHSGESAT